MSIEAVKIKLSSHSGTTPSDMTLQLKDDRGSVIATLSDDRRLLGYYSPYDGSESSPQAPPGISRILCWTEHSTRQEVVRSNLASLSPHTKIRMVLQMPAAHSGRKSALSLCQRLAGRHLQGAEVRDVGRRLRQAGKHIQEAQGTNAHGENLALTNYCACKHHT